MEQDKETLGTLKEENRPLDHHSVIGLMWRPPGAETPVDVFHLTIDGKLYIDMDRLMQLAKTPLQPMNTGMNTTIAIARALDAAMRVGEGSMPLLTMEEYLERQEAEKVVDITDVPAAASNDSVH